MDQADLPFRKRIKRELWLSLISSQQLLVCPWFRRTRQSPACHPPIGRPSQCFYHIEKPVRLLVHRHPQPLPSKYVNVKKQIVRKLLKWTDATEFLPLLVNLLLMTLSSCMFSSDNGQNVRFLYLLSQVA